MRLFISYRRSDSLDVAGRIFDKLASYFGPRAIFKDIASIPLGTDFRSVVLEEVELCDAVLAVIGPEWLSVADSRGVRRLNDPFDHVRLELEVALEHSIPVVPVLVSGAQMPSPAELPASLASLSNRNAISIRPDPDYHRDMDRLIRALESLPAKPTTGYIPRPPTVPDVDPAVVESRRVFVSHSTKDRDWVESEILQTLSANHISSWYYPDIIESSSQWEREILRGMEACDWFLLVVSPRSAESEWVKDELNWAIYFRPLQIVPVIMEQCNLWSFHIRLPRIQHIDFTRDRHRAKEKLVARFRQPG
jgi:hypothetical protein